MKGSFFFSSLIGVLLLLAFATIMAIHDYGRLSNIAIDCMTIIGFTSAAIAIAFSHDSQQKNNFHE